MNDGDPRSLGVREDIGGGAIPAIRVVRASRTRRDDLFVVTPLGPPLAGLAPEDEQDIPGAVRLIDNLLDQLDRAGNRAASVHELRLAIEAFVAQWQLTSSSLPLEPDDQRTGDALVHMASEVSKSDDPQREVLASAFRWFARKLDVFTDEAARAEGEAFGLVRALEPASQ